MTNEEAKELLDNLIGMVSDNQESDYDTALKMAIKALDQEPKKDTVSRQAVLDIIEKEEFKGDALSEIEKLPSVNPQRIGHWKPFDLTFGRNYYYCTSCEYATNMETVFKYCPNCGARMKGDKHD